MIINKIVSRNIKIIRLFEQKSQKELAKISGVSQSTIAQIESGKKMPSLATLVKISKALKVDTYKLLFPSEIIRW